MDLWNGYCWRRKNNDDTLAYFVSHLMNISGKVLNEPVKPEQLSRFHEKENKPDVEYFKERFKDALREEK